MCWQTKDLDYVRTKLREDIRATRERGRVPPPLRFAVWAGISVPLILLDAPLLAPVGIVLFEGLVAPRLARHRRPEIGPLAEWHPPDSFVISPDSTAPERSERR